MANYNSKNKDTYCPLAWEHQMIDSDGSYRLCCIADDKIKDKDGKPFNVRGTTLEEVWYTVASVSNVMFVAAPTTPKVAFAFAPSNNAASVSAIYAYQ